MKEYINVRSTKNPSEVEIDDYSVRVSTNIHMVEESEDTEYEFNQIHYTKDEYIKLISEKNTNLESQLTNIEMALVEIYEGANTNG